MVLVCFHSDTLFGMTDALLNSKEYAVVFTLQVRHFAFHLF
jgi:hypothetical protein